MRCKAGMLGANREIPWDLSTASYKQSLSVSAQTTSPKGVAFKDDGTILYVCSDVGNRVWQYAIATPWDISSATFVQSTVKTGPRGVAFKPDGTRMFLAVKAATEYVEEFSLSTAWDISTATSARSLDVSVQSVGLNAVYFKPDGSEMYLADDVGDDIHQYTLSAAWNISTASHTHSFSIDPQDQSPRGVTFKEDGKEMYVCGAEFSRVYQYSLASAWDISTATYIQSASTKDYQSHNIAFKPDGTKFYIAGNGTNAILEHEIT